MSENFGHAYIFVLSTSTQLTVGPLYIGSMHLANSMNAGSLMSRKCMFVVSKNRRKHHYSYGCFEKRYQEDGNTVLEAWIDADFTTNRNEKL